MSIVISNNGSAVKQIFQVVKNSIKKNSPELLVVGGTVAFVGTLFSMYKTTLKTKEIVDSANEEIEMLKNTTELREVNGSDVIEYTEEDKAEDIRVVKRRSAKKIVKAAAPTIILAMGTLSCFLGADYIRKQRHAALFAAAEMTLQSYNNYRQNVIEKYGPEVDQELKYNLFKKEEVMEETDPKTGKKKKKKEIVWDCNNRDYSDFARMFDEFNPNYQKNIFNNGKDTPYGVCNLDFVIKMQKAANQKLRKQGHLTLNEAYEMLGFDKTKAGSIAGWVFDVNDPSCRDDMHIDFGVLDRDKDEFKAILLGSEKSFVVDFNVDTLDIWEGFDDRPLFGGLPGRSV